MKRYKYDIEINKPVKFVYDAIMDKSLYPEWTSAWGEGMTFEGKWEEGCHVSFFDKNHGGTKVIIHEMIPDEAIKCEHIAMVDVDNNEVEKMDETMKKWIGTKEEYYFKQIGEDKTNLEVVMEYDPIFEDMMKGWNEALKLFKKVCEK